MNSLRIILLATFCLTLSACDHYMEERYLVRRDTATSSSGDAVATNSAVQIPDPWPRGSNDTNIVFDGEKIRCAVKRYRQEKEYPLDQSGTTGGGGGGLTINNNNGSGSSSAAGSGSSDCDSGSGTGAPVGAGSAMGVGAPPGQGY
jgi:hypothetical protein